MRLSALKRITNNFVEDWVRECSLQDPHKPRWKFFNNKCTYLSWKFLEELRLYKVGADVIHGAFYCGSGSFLDRIEKKSFVNINLDNWYSHSWLEVGNQYIIDVSIEQFIHTKKYVRPITDKRYKK